MKKLKYSSVFLSGALVSMALTSCSDDFLKEKRNYDNVSTEIYNYYEGADGRINDLYYWCNPNIQGATGGRLWQFVSMGMVEEQTQSTEEYAGLNVFVDPQTDLNTVSGTNQSPDYFQGGNAYVMSNSTWGRIRSVNETIAGIEAGTLSEGEKSELLGQAYFFRAWCYYQLFRFYGGVPIIRTVMDPTEGSVVPRSSASDVVAFMVADLNKSAEMLRARTVESRWESADYGRVTSGAALALKDRILLLWASPLFNRSNDKARWDSAYATAKADLNVINQCGFGLAYEGNPGKNGSNWAKLFLDGANNPEAVYVSLYNTTVPDLTPDYQRNNTWEQQIRPANTLGNNGKTPSAMIVDLFPMRDGKRPASYTSYTKTEPSAIPYDSDHPYLNRDPRFYRTFAFPGAYWRFNGDPNTSTSCNPYTGDKYILWNYVWYNDPAKYNDPKSSDSYGADNLLGSVHGMYVRKFSDDLDVNASPNYVFQTEGKAVGFRRCNTPTMEIRYTEVLLNLAEAACGAGHPDEAVQILQRIRARVGYTADNNYGLSANLSGDQAACMAAILYERQIEFAYEGKRFQDLRRWLLFDGGTGFAGIGATPLTGWGGNTCTWLGFKPLNGQRRENMEFRLQDAYNYTDGTSGRTWTVTSANPEERDASNPDPIIKLMKRAERDAYAVDPSESIVKKPFAEQLDNLTTFYNKYLVRKNLKGDGYDSNNLPQYINFKPRYYILGLTQSAQINNPKLEQTVGWEDYQTGSPSGTFDPIK